MVRAEAGPQGNGVEIRMRARLKPREPRQKVLIKARMRTASAWNDACILNISSHGLLLQAAVPPPRGSYIEVHRGRHIIIARVAWSKHHRLGVRTQDRLAIANIIDQPDCAAAPTAATAAQGIPDRRSTRRAPDRTHEHSRWRSRAIQFSFVAVFGASAATIAFQAVELAFAGALAQVGAALAVN